MMIVLHILFDLVVTAAVLAECVWVARKSRTLGAIVALGLGLRLVSGLGLFAISYFDLGILKGLHSGGGFWVLALDAQSYYSYAAAAAASSLLKVFWSVASPSYVAALALWLRATGTSVLAAILFNVACYGATVFAVMAGLGKEDRRHRFGWPAIVLCALSFSPVLLLTSTQTLKDPFFAMLSVIACRVAFEIFEGARRLPARGILALPTLIGVAVLALGLIGAMRAYYAAFLWLGLAVGYTAIVAVPGSARLGRAKLALIGTVTLTLTWLAFMIGGGPYYRMFKTQFTKLGLATAVQFNRVAFDRAGGGTNLSEPPVEALTGAASPPAHSFIIQYVGGVPESTPVADRDLPDLLNTLLPGTARNVYAVARPGAPDPAGASTTGDLALDSAVRQDHLEVTALVLSSDDRVPDDASLLVLVGDRVPSAQNPVAAFLEHGGKLLRVLEQDPHDPLEATWWRLQAVPMAHPMDEMIASGGPRHLVTGLLAMFVPVSILKVLSAVTFTGGQGLLLVTDADTVFLDLTLVAIAAVIVRGVRGVRGRPAVVARAPAVLFTLVVLGISTILLAYVVTNFGTLFRLRLLAAVPAWMAPFAFRSRSTADQTTSGSAGREV